MSDKIKIVKLPQKKFFYPYILKTLKELGHPAKRREMKNIIFGFFDMDGALSEEISKKTKISSARADLKAAGYVINRERGFWTIIDDESKKEKIDSIVKTLSGLENNYVEGEDFISKVEEEESISEFINEVEKLLRKRATTMRREGKDMRETQEIGEEKGDFAEQEEDGSIEEDLTFIKDGMDPGQFENLCVKLFEKLGYKEVVRTPATRDGGYDGEGYLIFNEMARFKVIFEAKHYALDKKIDVKLIRGFIGSMKNEAANMGVFITTADFSKDAEKEAKKNNIMLINGEKLIELLQENELGYDKKINKDFFKNIKQ